MALLAIKRVVADRFKVSSLKSPVWQTFFDDCSSLDVADLKRKILLVYHDPATVVFEDINSVTNYDGRKYLYWGVYLVADLIDDTTKLIEHAKLTRTGDD